MYVYLTRSARCPERKYVGLTEDFERRLAEHNDGESPSTYKFRPWKCEVRICLTIRKEPNDLSRISSQAAGVPSRIVIYGSSFIRHSAEPQCWRQGQERFQATPALPPQDVSTPSHRSNLQRCVAASQVMRHSAPPWHSTSHNQNFRAHARCLP